jgi:hypothetical protein
MPFTFVQWMKDAENIFESQLGTNGMNGLSSLMEFIQCQLIIKKSLPAFCPRIKLLQLCLTTWIYPVYSEENALNKAIALLTLLNEHFIKISTTKRSFYTKQAIILGQLLTMEGLSLDPRKVLNIRYWVRPNNSKKVQILVGLLQYLGNTTILHSLLFGDWMKYKI